MLQRIDIKNFGCFHDFTWKDEVTKEDGNVLDFLKLNILYGRNYTGKTTLSRLFRALETGKLPSGYENPEFSIKTDAGAITQLDIEAHSHEIRVFNRDFVDENLTFLRDVDGNIKPFAVLGEDNTRIEREIESKEKELGSVENQTGLQFEHSKKHSKWQQKVKELNQAKEDRTQKLSQKANQDIKRNPIFNDVNYNITKIEADIKKISEQYITPISNEEEEQYREILKQEPLPEISSDFSLDLKLPSYYQEAASILSKEVRPTEALQELLDDAVLQSWVRQGISLHRDKRKSCGFCGNPLPDDLWEKLDQHFSKESEEIEENIKSILQKIEKESNEVDNLIRIEKNQLYPALHEEFEAILSKICTEISTYKSELNRIAEELRARLADPFKTRELTELNDNTTAIEKAFSKLRALIERHKAQTKSLSEDQAKARERLRLGVISRFVSDINLQKIDSTIEVLEDEVSKLETEVSEAQRKVEEVKDEVDQLRKQLRDESRGAETVNKYLKHHFGHEGLKLITVEDASGEEGVQFEVRRGDEKAYNLSEGECSLLAFCYFIAKLEEIDSKGKDLIIFIDDPVSSLDSDHIFFAFSLIQGMIAAPTVDASGNKIDRYKQLFISTHNLDFLKFLKRLNKPQDGKKRQFIFVRKESGNAIELMPFYLRQYITEFHYLFDQICSCTQPNNITKNHHCFFSFGNNLRRFLEVYLFFKYPFCEESQRDYNTRLERFFNEDPATEPMVHRLTNELSHEGEAFERSLKPIDHTEISKMAKYILGKVKKQDPDQYADLLQATKWNDPLES